MKASEMRCIGLLDGAQYDFILKSKDSLVGSESNLKIYYIWCVLYRLNTIYAEPEHLLWIHTITP